MSRSIFIAAALALAVTLPVVSAQAQAPRTFVSAAGTDNSTCSFAAPCRHFQAAVNATSAGGEVDALDPAGYGPITITQAIAIEGQGWSYIAPPAGGNGITINAVSGNVYIHGVSLNGAGITGPTNGIVFNSGNSLNVRDSVIRNFKGDGIFFQPNTSDPQNRIFVSNTLISDNGGEGFFIKPSGSGPVKAVLNHVEMENNLFDGLSVNTHSQAVDVTVTDSVSANNGGDGIVVLAGVGNKVNVMVRNSTIANNVENGVEANGAIGSIRVTRSTITGNDGNGWANNVGAVTSYADNNIEDNFSVNNAPTQIIYK